MLSINLSITIESFFANTQRRLSKPAGKLLGTGQVQTSCLSMKKTAEVTAMQVSQLLYGECFDYFYQQGLGKDWYLVQSQRDQYVAYIHCENIKPVSFVSNAKIVKLSSPVYQSPEFKSPVVRQLPLGAQLLVDDSYKIDNQSEQYSDYLYSPPLQGWIYRGHLQLDNKPASDPVAIARAFIGQSYLWGGRSGWGCDCSSLVQLCYELCGCVLPRDTHLQREFTPAFTKDVIALSDIKAGDLIFWPGHVAIASSNSHLIHATCVGMQVIEEPIAQVCQRILVERSIQVIAVLRPILNF